MTIQSTIVSLGLLLLALPFLIFPRECAKLRYRHAEDPVPRNAALWEARILGFLLAGVAVALWIFWTFDFV
ncbi:hypothetical protein [Halomicrobium katesii]|uniref:hypothetical protein n=1 Tax=Halomicrobium katesii TaxID=437163 RepID=UPI000363F21F|nr:hypothetical protein [Halomicrobium katesii]